MASERGQFYFVAGAAHTRRIESLWSVLLRALQNNAFSDDGLGRALKLRSAMDSDVKMDARWRVV